MRRDRLLGIGGALGSGPGGGLEGSTMAEGGSFKKVAGMMLESLFYKCVYNFVDDLLVFFIHAFDNFVYIL
jgi:hypothetical protein